MPVALQDYIQILDLVLPITSQKVGKEMLGNHDFLGENKEWLIIYANEILKKRHVDYFIFGHRHSIEHKLNEKSTYINLGDWINHYTYVFDGKS